MKTLRDLGPGDEVAIMESARVGAVLIGIVTIDRVTPTQIVAGSRRWRRDERGSEIPARRRGREQHLVPATDAIRHGAERKELLRLIDHVFGSFGRYRYVRELSTDTLRTIAAALRADPATEGT